MASHITASGIDKIAHLARLELSSDEKKHLTKELESILKYIDRLSTVNTTDVPLFTNATQGLAQLRRDSVISFADPRLLLTKDRFKEDLLVTKGVFSTSDDGFES